MILQDEFKSNGYLNLLDSANIIDDEINLEDLFDIDDKPVELLGIYISQNRDELFFVLDGNIMDINELCDTWDCLLYTSPDPCQPEREAVPEGN